MWEHEDIGTSLGLRMYLKPYYIDSGGFLTEQVIMILKDPPNDVPTGESGLYFKTTSFHEVGGILNLQVTPALV